MKGMATAETYAGAQTIPAFSSYNMGCKPLMLAATLYGKKELEIPVDQPDHRHPADSIGGDSGRLRDQPHRDIGNSKS